MQELATSETVATLTAEVDRLKKYLSDYNASVTRKLDAIESDMLLLEAENSRLISVKEAAYIERDACVGLIAQLAASKGYRIGLASGNVVAIDLPSGQVSWVYNEGEAHLFADLPAYPDAIEEMPIEEKYRRVMNPGL